MVGALRSDRLQALADRIASAGGEAADAAVDVKRRDDLSRLVKLACERYAKLDVLVNNAGIAPTSLLDELRVDDRCQPSKASCTASQWRCLSSASRASGIFISMASTAGLIAKPTMSVYSGTKFAVRAISEVCARKRVKSCG